MIEAMKQALEALEYPLNTSHETFDVDMAELLAHRDITSLRQAIAEAEPVYTHPQPKPWVGLTVDELIDLEGKHRKHEDLTVAIEAKLKEKNHD